MIMAGFGMRENISETSLQDALDQTGYVPEGLATLADKAEIGAFQAFAQRLNLPIYLIENDALKNTPTQTQSAISLQHRDTGSVAEAAAMIGAGRGARLVSTRKISNDRLATCAIAITEGS